MATSGQMGGEQKVCTPTIAAQMYALGLHNDARITHRSHRSMRPTEIFHLARCGKRILETVVHQQIAGIEKHVGIRVSGGAARHGVLDHVPVQPANGLTHLNTDDVVEKLAVEDVVLLRCSITVLREPGGRPCPMSLSAPALHA